LSTLPQRVHLRNDRTSDALIVPAAKPARANSPLGHFWPTENSFARWRGACILRGKSDERDCHERHHWRAYDWPQPVRPQVAKRRAGWLGGFF